MPCCLTNLCLVYSSNLGLRFRLASVRSGPSHQRRARNLARLVPWSRAHVLLLPVSDGIFEEHYSRLRSFIEFCNGRRWDYIPAMLHVSMRKLSGLSWRCGDGATSHRDEAGMKMIHFASVFGWGLAWPFILEPPFECWLVGVRFCL